jgi:hypothetical protein
MVQAKQLSTQWIGQVNKQLSEKISINSLTTTGKWNKNSEQTA